MEKTEKIFIPFTNVEISISNENMDYFKIIFSEKINCILCGIRVNGFFEKIDYNLFGNTGIIFKGESISSYGKVYDVYSKTPDKCSDENQYSMHSIPLEIKDDGDYELHDYSFFQNDLPYDNNGKCCTTKSELLMSDKLMSAKFIIPKKAFDKLELSSVEIGVIGYPIQKYTKNNIVILAKKEQQ